MEWDGMEWGGMEWHVVDWNGPELNRGAGNGREENGVSLRYVLDNACQDGGLRGSCRVCVMHILQSVLCAV